MLQMLALLRDLWRLSSYELDLRVAHLGDSHRAEDDVWQGLDKVALDDCFGDGVDEVFQFVFVVRALGVEGFRRGEGVHVALDGFVQVLFESGRVDDCAEVESGGFTDRGLGILLCVLCELLLLALTDFLDHVGEVVVVGAGDG